jgi:hypothetical protein
VSVVARPLDDLDRLAFRPLRQVERLWHRRRADLLERLLRNRALRRTHVWASSLFLCNPGPVLVSERLSGNNGVERRRKFKVNTRLIQDINIPLAGLLGLSSLLDLHDLLAAGCGQLARLLRSPGGRI